jgi:hypothetical protein
MISDELGNHLGDIDIGQVRAFTAGNMQMYQFLGQNQGYEAGTPGNERYWKNTIPEDYSIYNRSGITFSNGYIQDIDESSDQIWSNNYYYPVLPKINKFGKFDDELGLQGEKEIGLMIFPPNEPYGTPGRNWNEDDEQAPITDTEYKHPDMIIDIDFSEISENSLAEKSANNNIGMLIHDYLLQIDSTQRANTVKQSQMHSKTKVKQKNKRKAF